MHLDLSKLPPNVKLELTKEDLIAFAETLLSKNSEATNRDLSDFSEQPIGAEDVAKLLKVSKQHIYYLTSKKKIPHKKKGKRPVSYTHLTLPTTPYV